MRREEKDLWDTVIEYLPLIEKMVYLYLHKIDGYEYDDLYQEACIVVYDQIPKYDPSRGMSLERFLIIQIRYHFLDLLNKNKFVVYVPLIYGRAAYRLVRVQAENKIKTGNYLSPVELKEQVNLSQSAIEALEISNRTMCRNMTTSLSDIEEAFGDSIEEDMDAEKERRKKNFEESFIWDVDMEEDFIFSSLKEDMYEKLDHLSPKQRECILYHLGFMTEEKELFRDIAKVIGGSTQNAHKLYKRGIKQLQKTMLEDWN